jgi:regulator of G-protein signaling
MGKKEMTYFSVYFLPGGRHYFRDFLRSEYSEENFLFWMSCESLKNEQNPDRIEEKARSIYEDYISILSPKEVKTKRLKTFLV